MFRLRRLGLALLALGAVALLGSGGSAPADDAELAVVQMIDNGGFEEAVPADALGAFWLATVGRGRVGIPTPLVTGERSRTGAHALKLTSADQTVTQYVPAFGGLADRITIAASIHVVGGRSGSFATLTLRDSLRREVVYVCGENPRLPADSPTRAHVGVPVAPDAWTDLTFDYGSDFVEHFGENPQPRLTLLLGRQDAGDAPIYWDDVEAHVPFLLLSEAALLDRILDEARWVIDNLREHAVDDLGTPSPFLIKTLDAVTGEVLGIKVSGGGGPVYNQMLSFLAVREDPEYRAALIGMADAAIEGLHPTTGLPRKYNGETDAWVDGNAIPAPSIDFFLRMYELAGEDRYLDAAVELGEAILRYGPTLRTSVRSPIPIPPDYLPNTYNSATGLPVAPESTYVQHIRWFASPGALVHLYTATGRTDFRDAALASALSYVDHDTVLHYWNEDYELMPFSFEPVWYDWDKIDPAFDDYFGYGIGGRGGPFAILDIYERTGDPRLRPFLDASLDQMGAVWWEGMHRGGYTFADDARSWQAYYDRYVTDPVVYAGHKDLLIRNARNVFRSSQIANGAWIDARFRLWNPSFPDDQASGPRNLLAALTWAYIVDERDPVWRAMIASVFETAVATYKSNYGYVGKPDGPVEGANAGGFELRLFGELLSNLVPHLAVAE